MRYGTASAQVFLRLSDPFTTPVLVNASLSIWFLEMPGDLPRSEELVEPLIQDGVHQALLVVGGRGGGISEGRRLNVDYVFHYS